MTTPGPVCAGCGGPGCAQRPVPSPVPDALTQRVADAIRPVLDGAGPHTTDEWAALVTVAALAALAPELAELLDACRAADERAEAMEFAMRSTADDALKHGGCHRKLMTQVRRAEQAEAALTRVRELHRPVTWPADPPQPGPGAEYFDGPVTVCAADSDHPNGRTYWTPWPCATIRALNTPATATAPEAAVGTAALLAAANWFDRYDTDAAGHLRRMAADIAKEAPHV